MVTSFLREGYTPPCDGRTTAAVMVTHAGIALHQLYLLEIIKLHMINKEYHEVLSMFRWYNKHEERVTGDGCPHKWYRLTIATVWKTGDRFSMN